MILLDTCALIWLNDYRAKFSRRTMEILDRNSDALAVSPVSFMETEIKSNRKGFQIPFSLNTWCDKICEKYSLTVIPVSKNIAVEAASLPEIHFLEAIAKLSLRADSLVGVQASACLLEFDKTHSANTNK